MNIKYVKISNLSDALYSDDGLVFYKSKNMDNDLQIIKKYLKNRLNYEENYRVRGIGFSLSEQIELTNSIINSLNNIIYFDDFRNIVVDQTINICENKLAIEYDLTRSNLNLFIYSKDIDIDNVMEDYYNNPPSASDRLWVYADPTNLFSNVLNTSKYSDKLYPQNILTDDLNKSKYIDNFYKNYLYGPLKKL